MSCLDVVWRVSVPSKKGHDLDAHDPPRECTCLRDFHGGAPGTRTSASSPLASEGKMRRCDVRLKSSLDGHDSCDPRQLYVSRQQVQHAAPRRAGILRTLLQDVAYGSPRTYQRLQHVERRTEQSSGCFLAAVLSLQPSMLQPCHLQEPGQGAQHMQSPRSSMSVWAACFAARVHAPLQRVVNHD